MVCYGGKYYKEFKPTPITKMEKFKLFFKRMKTKREVIIKTDNIETACVVYYKILGDKIFLLDEQCFTHIKLPTVQIISNEKPT